MRTLLKSKRILIYAGLVALIILTIVTIPFVRGFDAPFTAVSDADLIYVSQPLLFNSHRPQSFYDHTGYLMFLLTSLWFRFSEMLGSIPVANWDALAISSEPFGTLFAPLVLSGRIFIVLLAIMFAFSFGYCVYILTKNSLAALLGTLLLTSSMGFGLHTIVIRAELLSAYFFMLSVFSIIIAGKQRTFSLKLVGFFLFGLFAYLATLAKYQIIIGILFLPALIILWEDNSEGYHSKIPRDAWLGGVAIGLITILPPTLTLIRAWPLEGYHLLIAIYFLVFLAIYHRGFSRSFPHTTLIAFSIFAGIAVAFSYNLPAFSYRNTENIVHFYSRGMVFASESNLRDLGLFLSFLGNTFLDKVAFLKSSVFALAYYLAILLTGLLVQKKEYKNSIRIGSLLILAISMEALYRIRYFADRYRIYVEFLIVLSIVLAWLLLMRGGYFPRLSKNLSIPIVLIAIAVMSFSQSIYKVNTNGFDQDIWQQHENFCGMTVFTSELAQLVNSGTPEQCIEIITAGCARDARISSCKLEE